MATIGPPKPHITLNEEIISKLEGTLGQLGMDLRSACFLCDVPPDTVNNWIREGKKNPDSLYGALLKKMSKAVAIYEGGLLKELNFTHVKGRPAEYKEMLLSEKTLPDGTIEKKYIQIKTKDEIKPDPRVAQWLMSKRFKAKWGDSLDVHITKDVIDEAVGEEEVNYESQEERLKLLKRIKESLPDEG